MSLKNEVVALLRNNVVAKIYFRYDSSLVSGSSFKRLASDILAGKIDVVTDDLSEGAGAEYHYHSTHDHPDSIVLPKSWAHINTTWRKMSVIHEATHALQDKAAKTMNDVASESPAFVAEAVYTKLAGRKHSVFDPIKKAPRYNATRVIYRRAWLAAEELMGPPKRTRVPGWRVKHINNAVHAHSLYDRKDSIEYDGI